MPHPPAIASTEPVAHRRIARKASAVIPQRLKHLAEYLVVRVLICLVQAVRIETCHAGAGYLAFIFADVLHIRGKVVDDNLRHAFPQYSQDARRRMTRDMWQHLFLFAAEVAHLPRKVHASNWRDYIRLEGRYDMVRVLLGERPALLVSGHFGNFELAGYVLGLIGFPTYTVARQLDNPYLDRFVGRFRGATGQYILPKKGGYDGILEVLARGGVITFLSDQYAGRKGCWVEFFGRPASTHKAIALLALDSDAVLAVGAARRTGGPLQYEISVDAVCDSREVAQEPDAVRRLTQWYTSELEAMILKSPEQYWWVHRRWKDHRPKHRRRRAA